MLAVGEAEDVVDEISILLHELVPADHLQASRFLRSMPAPTDRLFKRAGRKPRGLKL